MAIISCPRCAKKISDKSQSCQHCQLDLSGMSDERKHHLAIEARDKKLQSCLNQSMLALILFLAGFCFLYFWALEPDGYEAIVSKGMIALGFLWYIYARARLIYLKRKN